MKAIILAAGLGSRLGLQIPKALVRIDDENTILDLQLRALRYFVRPEDIFIVVGYRKELIIDQYPGLTFVFNERFAHTNTSKSLLKALRRTRGEDTVWLNGDVYLSPEVLARVAETPASSVAVNTSRVADEEVKYVVNSRGVIAQISKSVQNALGESVGVNKVVSNDWAQLVHGLSRCKDTDYFEAGMEMSLDRIDFLPVDISDLSCIEVDFPDDLQRARSLARDPRTLIERTQEQEALPL
jgi:choline kinase